MQLSVRPSISVFFPCYNDKGTIGSLVIDAKGVLDKLTDEYEIIVIDDGSTDGSRDFLRELQSQYQMLRLVFHDHNRGYGAAIQSGIAAATKDLVFYTDGDGQYDVKELPLLYAALTDDIDIVNGFKIKRNDPWYRLIIGKIYHFFVSLMFGLKIRDVDCDFRLMRRKIFDVVKLESHTGTVCVELVKRIQDAGFRFAEVGVSHYHRIYGQSQFFNFPRVARSLWQLAGLWVNIVVKKKRSGQ
ncbi:MAG: glycosyltransferase family 2 protein [Candidatus Komeilibacteria bacterium]